MGSRPHFLVRASLVFPPVICGAFGNSPTLAISQSCCEDYMFTSRMAKNCLFWARLCSGGLTNISFLSAHNNAYEIILFLSFEWGNWCFIDLLRPDGGWGQNQHWRLVIGAIPLKGILPLPALSHCFLATRSYIALLHMLLPGWTVPPQVQISGAKWPRETLPPYKLHLRYLSWWWRADWQSLLITFTLLLAYEIENIEVTQLYKFSESLSWKSYFLASLLPRILVTIQGDDISENNFEKIMIQTYFF
jgi:hypothetical protein